MVLGGTREVSRIAVKNEGSDRIEKYRYAVLKASATVTRVGEEYIVPVQSTVSAEAGSNRRVVGVTVNAIDPGDVGTLIIQGPAFVETDGTITVASDFGDFIYPDLTAASGGIFNDATGTAVGTAISSDLTEFVDIDFGTSSKQIVLAIVDFSFGNLETLA